MAFPGAALFLIFGGMLRINIELRSMSEYSKRDQPAPILDIGVWLEVLELMVDIGINITSYMILFTSKKLSDFGDFVGLNDESSVIICFFVLLHVIYGIKDIAQETISDEPAWI